MTTMRNLVTTMKNLATTMKNLVLRRPFWVNANGDQLPIVLVLVWSASM